MTQAQSISVGKMEFRDIRNIVNIIKSRNERSKSRKHQSHSLRLASAWAKIPDNFRCVYGLTLVRKKTVKKRLGHNFQNLFLKSKRAKTKILKILKNQRSNPDKFRPLRKVVYKDIRVHQPKPRHQIPPPIYVWSNIPGSPGSFLEVHTFPI